MSSAEKTPITLSLIKVWLPILLILISVVAGWTIMDQRIQQLQTDQALLVIKVEKFGLENVLVQVRLAEIQKDISYIRLAIDAHMKAP